MLAPRWLFLPKLAESNAMTPPPPPKKKKKKIEEEKEEEEDKDHASFH